MRSDLSGDPTFRELLGRKGEVALEAYAHQDHPSAGRGTAAYWGLELQPAFQVVFALQNADGAVSCPV